MTGPHLFLHPRHVNIVARTCFVLSVGLLVSCSSGQSNPSAPKTPQPSWTGMWTKLDGLAIPPEKRILLPQSCTQTPEYWTINQTKSQITLEMHESTVASGVKMAVERRKIEKAQGQLRGSVVHLDGEAGTVEVGDGGIPLGKPRPAKFPVTYDLQYDPKTEHLAGTRNGAPVRFIRAELAPVNYANCKPVQ